MEHHSIVQDTEKFVRTLLAEKLSIDLYYHNLPHTLSVKEACEQLAIKADLQKEEREALILAALLHDTGFTEVYEGHEEKSQLIAVAFLKAQAYPEERIEKVKTCIQATYPPYTPEGHLEKLIRDADMYHLSSKDYMQFNETLRHEWEVFQGLHYSDAEWLQLNYEFFSNHDYYTDAAQELFGPQKALNFKALKKYLMIRK